MVKPIRPTRAAESDEPCAVCGGKVVIRQVELPKRLGASTVETADQRVCLNASCRTNAPRGSQRLGGESP